MAKLQIKFKLDDLSDEFFDKYFAHKFSELTTCGAPELTDRPRGWLAAFILNSCFVFQITDSARAYIFNYLRRVEAACFAYTEARKALLENHATRKAFVSNYFRSLLFFETCVTQLYQGAELLHRPMGQKIFTPGDNSRLEMLQKLYVSSKHMDQMISGGKLPKGATSSFWITNSGLESALGSLTFNELNKALEEMSDYADQLVVIEKPRKN